MKNNYWLIVGLLIVLLGGYFVYTQSAKTNTQTLSAPNGKILITASFYPMYFFTSQIAGDKAEVVNLTPAGAEPHDYELTTQDRAKIENSKLLVLNGGGLEPWGDKIRDDLKGKPIVIVSAGDDIANKQVEEEGKTIQDPHVWLSARLAKQEVVKITQALEQVDPGNKTTYEANMQSLDNKLDDLDKTYKSGLASCQKKDIITSHAAFGYMGAAYGLNQVPIAGLSPDTEPSPKQLADVAQFAKANNVKYIFFESLVSPKLSDTIASEIGAQTLVLNPIEGLSDDEIKSGKDYFSEMENNLKNLRLALQCQ